MDSLDSKLEAIAHMMDPSRGHSRDEIMVWKALIHHVDRDIFERTGRIVVSVPAPADLAGSTVPRLRVGSVESAIESLAARGLLENAPGEPLRYQLFLAPSEERISAL